MRRSCSVSALNDSQRARVLFGQRGQEDVGEVDEQSADGLFGRVKKPGKERAERVKTGVGLIYLPVFDV